jgi:hypothetical protein
MKIMKSVFTASGRKASLAGVIFIIAELLSQVSANLPEY